MKVFIALMLLTSLAQAETYQCTFEESNASFLIVEDDPIQGQATIHSSDTEPVVLKFVKSTTRGSTRLGDVIYIKTSYLNPYYEYQITSALYIFEPGFNSEHVEGSFISEMNPSLAFSCTSFGLPK